MNEATILLKEKQVFENRLLKRQYQVSIKWIGWAGGYNFPKKKVV